MGQRPYNAVFTADTVEPRTAKNGKPYLRARGTIANRTGAVTRTVLVQGAGYETVAARMRIGEPLGLRGFYRRVDIGGRPGGQFFSAFGLTNAKNGAGACGTSTARTSSEEKVSADDREAVVIDIAQARDDKVHAVRAPTWCKTVDANASDAVRTTEDELVLITPLIQLEEHERPAAPTIEQLEAANRAGPPVATTMLLDGVETEIGSDWTPAAPRSVEGHDREGYWRRQHHGPRNSLIKVIWIQATRVKGGASSARHRVVAPMTLALD